MIDNAIAITPVFVSSLRPINPAFGIKNEEDFAFGFIYGLIMGQSRVYMLSNYEEASEADLRAAASLVVKRTKEIKEAIFKAG